MWRIWCEKQKAAGSKGSGDRTVPQPRRIRPTSPPPHSRAAGFRPLWHALPRPRRRRHLPAALPTTPFLLLAVACYARSSRRLFNWLLNHARLGPLIREWHEHRAIPYRAKRTALLLIALSFSISIAFFVPGWPAKLVMGVGGLVLMVWIARIPSRDAPSRVS